MKLYDHLRAIAPAVGTRSGRAAFVPIRVAIYVMGALAVGSFVVGCGPAPHKQRSKQPRRSTSVVGRVEDETGRPVVDAIVRWRTRETSTMSDTDGRFVLPAVDRATRVTAAKHGYRIGGVDVPDDLWMSPTI
ncbi:MAG: carboxypeptidase-like regulatory domain-containing protein [Pirellulaceae bacterium]|jgi:hypothetical protein|nr:carboxypeptidase-like regulatory domain-containing protein [Pirellulaceae bacterium]MDP7018858.1 carboxypeptidase-like regulatory domain-containing protein [Pirellulaceae bacterium]